jgi:pimeloyl-ACP methyl ester carboxylesterase
MKLLPIAVLLLTRSVAAADHQEQLCQRLLALAETNPRLEFERRDWDEKELSFIQGFFSVPEDRASDADPDGREIRIGMVILPARSDAPKADPVWMLHGGPGAGAIAFFSREVDGWLRDDRDVILVDQRGTGSSNALTIPHARTDDDLQSYFGSYFETSRYLAALPEILERADPRQYTTNNAVDDFDELRAALGYEQVNIRGGSYGTRSGLVWMRRHPESIRTASLQGVQSMSYLNPMPHARMAQRALDMIFDEIEADRTYNAAFPDLRADFWATLKRLDETPAQVELPHPQTGEPTVIRFGKDSFAESVRLQLYSVPSNRRLPRLLQRAHAGDYAALAQARLDTERALLGVIAWGTLLSVTGSEDAPRMDRDAIARECANTFLGETRIREQLAMIDLWPCGQVGDDFGAPITVDVPTLLWSGSHDPSTAPQWAEEVHGDLPNSVHVVIPSGHGVYGPEVQVVDRAFLDSGSVDGLELSDVEALELPPLELPAGFVADS